MNRNIAFYAVHNQTRQIFEVNPVGASLLVRPAQLGQERNVQKIEFIDFDRNFNAFLAKFLIPNQLREEDWMEAINP
jgi:hypothetical protein